MARRSAAPGRAAGTIAGVLTAVVAAVALGACAPKDDPPSTARAHLRNRLQLTTTASQARCVVDHLDDRAAIALDQAEDLPASSRAMRAYSDAMVACVAGL